MFSRRKAGWIRAALALPGFSFVGQQAIADHASEGAVVRGLGEIAWIGDQDVFDVARMHQQTYGNVEITKANDVAIVPGALGIEFQPIARGRRQVAEQEVALGAGRKFQRNLAATLYILLSYVIGCGVSTRTWSLPESSASADVNFCRMVRQLVPKYSVIPISPAMRQIVGQPVISSKCDRGE